MSSVQYLQPSSKRRRRSIGHLLHQCGLSHLPRPGHRLSSCTDHESRFVDEASHFLCALGARRTGIITRIVGHHSHRVSD